MKSQESDKQERLERELARMRQDQTWQQYKSRLLQEMSHHIGKDKAIGMGELFSVVFGRPWANRINDTRVLRDLIEEVQWGDAQNRPILICSCTAGYYLPIGQEAREYIQRRLIAPAKKKLKKAARLQAETYKELMGRLVLEG